MFWGCDAWGRGRWRFLLVGRIYHSRKKAPSWALWREKQGKTWRQGQFIAPSWRIHGTGITYISYIFFSSKMVITIPFPWILWWELYIWAVIKCLVICCTPGYQTNPLLWGLVHEPIEGSRNLNRSVFHGMSAKGLVHAAHLVWNFTYFTMTRWWFQVFFIFTPIWGRFPIWLICLKWVETTN